MSNRKGRGSRIRAFMSRFTLYASHFTLHEKGFTLIEVLVSLAVVSGVFLLALTSFSYHIDIFDRKKDSLKLVLQAKENLYRYRTGRLIELAGTLEGIQYEITVEDMEYHLKKVTSRAMSGRDEAFLLEYMRK